MFAAALLICLSFDGINANVELTWLGLLSLSMFGNVKTIQQSICLGPKSKSNVRVTIQSIHRELFNCAMVTHLTLLHPHCDDSP